MIEISIFKILIPFTVISHHEEFQIHRFHANIAIIEIPDRINILLFGGNETKSEERNDRTMSDNLRPQRLELTWINKGVRPFPEPRI